VHPAVLRLPLPYDISLASLGPLVCRARGDGESISNDGITGFFCSPWHSCSCCLSSRTVSQGKFSLVAFVEGSFLEGAASIIAVLALKTSDHSHQLIQQSRLHLVSAHSAAAFSCGAFMKVEKTSPLPRVLVQNYEDLRAC